MTAAHTAFDFSGTILRKKNISADYLKLAIQEEGKDKSTTIYLPRKEPVCTPADFDFLHLAAVIRVRGRLNADAYPHVTHCDLVTCAPNFTMIKGILGGANYRAFASVLGTDAAALQRLVEGHSRKVAVQRVVEALTGRPAKAPPRYRPGRVRRADLDVLERKEAEGRGAEATPDGGAWRLCAPCGAGGGAAPVARRAEPVVNLPDGAGDVVSAHGKLTRAEYLETKKNHQAAWFVARLRQFDTLPARCLDVGGGRGDLAVHIASHFPDMEVVVVDSNARSVAAGRDYAAKRGVAERVEFCCMDFADYGDEYDAGRRARVDCVVALHACGDLSDLALSFAADRGAAFVICPCCYPKRYLAPFVPHWHRHCSAVERDSLARLAELDDHRAVSRRAMLVVNSMRRTAFGERRVALEEFDSKISGRNIALVGVA